MRKEIRRFASVCLFAATFASSTWAQQLGPRNDIAADASPGKAAPTKKYAPDGPISTSDYKPDHNPTQKEISALGGLSGALSPIGNANEDELIRQLNEAVRRRIIAPKAAQPAARIDRLRRSNRMFALAMNDWNNNRRDEAVATFRTFARIYRDSPWSGEALLHIAKIALTGGRYVEARDTYQYVLQNTSGVFGGDSYEINMKARQGLMETDIVAGNLQGAKEKLRDILKTVYTYDANGRLTQVTRTKGASSATLATYTYNARNQVLSATDTRGITLTYAYTDLDQVDKITYPDATFIDPTRCSCGLLTSVMDRGGKTTSYEYDGLKRLKKVTDPAGRIVQTTYDAAGNVTDLTDQAGIKTHWAYDNKNRAVAKMYAYTSPSNPVDEKWSYDVDDDVV